RDSYHEISQLIKREQPDIAHFHNTFPLISPSAYYACAAANVPVIQTVHNPRLFCPAATLFRDGHLCEDCVGRTIAIPAIVNACYHDSHAGSAAVALMLSAHQLLGSWKEKVSRYIVSTEFYKERLTRLGIPFSKIAIKPHFVDNTFGGRTR